MAMWIYRSPVAFETDIFGPGACLTEFFIFKKGTFTMLVYVLNQNGLPLMPTGRGGRVRWLLKTKQAKVVKRKPFTIQLLYESPDIVQFVEHKEDTGYLHIGSSACSDKAELYSAEIEMNPNIKNNLQSRCEYRRTRRNRLRHRACRIDNRKRGESWLPPSIQHKVDTHVKEARKVASILPIAKVTIEVGTFDIQKIKNPNISGKEYQEGELNDFRNLREYIFFRDNYTCQICGKSIFEHGISLHMHHIEFWLNGNRANTPANTMTVCNKCHSSKNHQKNGKLWGLRAKFRPLKAETYMSTVRWRIVNAIKEALPGVEVVHTYGYLTKDTRIKLGVEKTHANDAYCIGDKHPAERLADTVYYKQKSKNNRSLEKFYDAKYIDSRDGKTKPGKELFSGRTTRNKNLNSENLHIYRKKKVKKGSVSIRKQRYSLQPNDTVKWKNRFWLVKGVHCNGTRVMLKNGKSVAIKDVELINRVKTIYEEVGQGQFLPI